MFDLFFMCVLILIFCDFYVKFYDIRYYGDVLEWIFLDMFFVCFKLWSGVVL